MDVKSEAKRKVLEEIMALMDQSEGDMLKSKSPKMVKMEMEAEKLPLDEEKPELKPEMSDDEMDDEDKRRLLELYEKMR